MKLFLIRAMAWLSGASKEVLLFVLPILRDSTAALLSQLLPIALEVVASLAEKKQPGRVKRMLAAEQIQRLAVAEGVAASNRMVNLAIELALQKLEGGEK
jgi:hypothetical protein